METIPGIVLEYLLGRMSGEKWGSLHLEISFFLRPPSKSNKHTELARCYVKVGSKEEYSREGFLVGENVGCRLG